MANIDENRLEVRFKKLCSSAKTPVKMRDGDGAYDLSTIEDGTISTTIGVTKFHTGIAVAIPRGYVGLIWCRGGLGMKGVDVHGGVIDSNYRGEIIVGLSQHMDLESGELDGESMEYVFEDIEIKAGERIAQLIIQKSEDVDFVEVDNLDDTERGDSGFGSSDHLK